jgi:hypothetical protein
VEGGTYRLADMYCRGPNPLADVDRGVQYVDEIEPGNEVA